jgi:hypothetical protein
MTQGDVLSFWVAGMIGLFSPRAGFATLAMIAGLSLTGWAS